jgi:hypothetical protein
MKTLKIFAAIFLTFGLLACSDKTPANAVNSTNTNTKNTENSTPNEVSPTKTSDSSTVTLDYNKISNSSIDELNKFKGKTIILKGKLDEWTTSKIKVAIGSTTAFCEGDFYEYKDAIELFAKNKKSVTVSFRGTLIEASDLNVFTDLKMNDCVITDLEK